MSQLGFAADSSRLFQIAGDYNERSMRLLPSVSIDDEVERSARVFHSPEGYGDAARILGGSEERASYPVVILSGELGTGRRSSALSLLGGSGGVRHRELMPDWDVPRADVLPAELGCHYLLDLTFEPFDVPEGFVRGLFEFAPNLQNANSVLVIIVTPDRWMRCEAFASQITVQIGLPRAISVLDKHLAVSAPPRTSEMLRQFLPLAGIISSFEDRDHLPRHVVDFVRLVAAHDKLDDESAEAIYNGFHHWKSLLDSLLGDTRDANVAEERSTIARRRALLISAAFLNGASTDVVFDSSHVLLQQIKAFPPADELLSGPESSGLLGAIGAEVVGDRVSLTARHNELDHAVVRRVWIERPQLRRHILDWVANITTDRGAAAREAERVSRVLVRIAVEQRSADVIDVIQRWMEGKSHQRRLAVRLLGDLSVSGDIGPAVRRRLYQLVSAAGTPPRTLEGIAEVCSGRFGARFPVMALVRLRLLIERSEKEVRRAALLSVGALAATSDGIRRVVVRQIADWAGAMSYRKVGIETSLFLLNSANVKFVPQILIDADRDAGIAEYLESSWQILLDGSETRTSALGLAEAWLKAADDGLLNDQQVLRLLVPAIKRNIDSEGVARFVLKAGAESRTREQLILRLVRPGQSTDGLSASTA